jgi:hypothetical protein
MKLNNYLLASALAAAFLSGCGGGDHGVPPASTNTGNNPPAASVFAAIDESKMVSTAEATAWLKEKDTGPHYVASPLWKQWMASLESRMKSYGMVDFLHYTFPYDRWYTTEYPDTSGWSLTSNGTPVNLASYATFSGNTGPGGVTAPMIVYDLNLPAAQRPSLADMKGKIVVIRQQLYSTAAATATGQAGLGLSYPDYEYRSNDDTFLPVGKVITPDFDADGRNRNQSTAGNIITSVLTPSGAVGAIWVVDMSPDAAKGHRQHSTPNNYNVPGVVVDRVAGAKVLADAAAGATATLVLNANVEKNAAPYQLVGYLPGKDYGTDKDQQVLLVTHTDGMSVVEDDGALGIMATLKYYSQIPQSQRPRTLLVWLDNRHFIAGAEAAYPYDYMVDFQDAAKKLVAGVAMEHFGGKQFHEVGDVYEATGRAAHTNVFTFPNQLAIDTAIQVVKDVNLQRAIVSAPTASGMKYNRPGVNGASQGFWFGGTFMDSMVQNGHLPGWHVSGDWPSTGIQAYYPAYGTRVDPELFRTDARAAIRLVGVMMKEDLTKYAPDWGVARAYAASLADTDFAPTASAQSQRTLLVSQADAIFALVKDGKYDVAGSQLTAFRASVDAQLVAGANKTALLQTIDSLAALAKQGAKLPA